MDRAGKSDEKLALRALISQSDPRVGKWREGNDLADHRGTMKPSAFNYQPRLSRCWRPAFSSQLSQAALQDTRGGDSGCFRSEDTCAEGNRDKPAFCSLMNIFLLPSASRSHHENNTTFRPSRTDR